MNLNKAIKSLDYLVDNEPNDLLKYTKVYSLISEFKERNRSANGALKDSYIEEKITGVSSFFEELCDLGDGGFSKEKICDNLRQYIYNLKNHIDTLSG